MDSFPKTIAYWNSYRNARITTVFEFVDKLDLHTLYNISHWQLRILAAPLDFSAPKKLSLGDDCPSPAPPAPTPLSHEILTVKLNLTLLVMFQMDKDFNNSD